jgi:HK97 family phage prohead protease
MRSTSAIGGTIHAKDATAAAIAKAFDQQSQHVRWGPLGPIGDMPMVRIPCAGPAGQPRAVVQPPIVTARQRLGAHPYVMPKAWRPSYHVVGGLAASYGTPIPDKHGRPMAIAQFAFAAAILDGEIFVTVNHREDLRLASRLDGTLRLWETSKGLFFEMNAVGSPDARAMDIDGMARRGAFIGASIWYAVADRYPAGTDGVQRMGRAEALFEVSLITRPSVPSDRRTWISVGESGQLHPPTERLRGVA